MNSIFDQVIYIGPDMNAKGGIASVLKSYQQNLPTFHYLKTNSCKGKLIGSFHLIYTLAALPIHRLFTSRKIIHIHVATGKSFIRKSWIISWAKILGFKVIYHNHAGSIISYFDKIGHDKALKTINKCCSAIVLSDNVKKYFQDTLGYKNVNTINNIVDHANPSLSYHDTGELKIIYFGLINKNKGVFDLIDVFVKHKSEFSNKVKLTICGIGETDEFMHLIRENSLENIIQFEGWVSGKKKFELLADSDILILPSYIEGLPISLLEAMAYSKAIISTNVGGIPSILQNGYNGFLIEPGDKIALFNAIKHYIDNPQDVKLHGANGNQMVVPFYPEEVIKQLETLYNTL